MTPADTYRMYATIAADMAAETTDSRHRASLLEMAQAWHELAEKEDQPLPLQAHAQAQQPAQQQQQPQPDEDKDEEAASVGGLFNVKPSMASRTLSHRMA